MTRRMKIAIGADHGGFDLKEELLAYLQSAGHTVEDVGTSSREAVDYPLFARAVAKAVSQGRADVGIMIDGAGIGSCMVANKVPGVRAALAYDLSSARNSREHNNANVLTLGAGLIGENLAWQIIQEWLTTEWGGDRHALKGRIKQLRVQIEATTSNYDKERLQGRLAKLSGGVAVINVGAATETDGADDCCDEPLDERFADAGVAHHFELFFDDVDVHAGRHALHGLGALGEDDLLLGHRQFHAADRTVRGSGADDLGVHGADVAGNKVLYGMGSRLNFLHYGRLPGLDCQPAGNDAGGENKYQ